ncbi:protein BTG2-like [Ischnura elegans]|uniref:protein BTG2-like n=1 Tax=Ischnura elegans TaxID=197161 RepID=UPI001ED8ABDB|nr:protein BTG2-like [Ischnura elegans]
MRMEILSAADFLVHLLRLNQNRMSESQLELFKASLTEVLRRRYRDHWFPERPTRGSGYRCLRINGKMDPVIAQAGESIGLPGPYLHSLFPSELTMWIDPQEVSYRIGENGSICVLYEEKSPDSGEEYVLDRVGPTGKENSCKESLRSAYLFLEAQGVPFEQMAPYVSS